MTGDAFPPEVMDLMAAAFDAAYDSHWQQPSQAAQVQIASRIMAAVRVGERDPSRLTAIALGEAALPHGSDTVGPPAPTDRPANADLSAPSSSCAMEAVCPTIHGQDPG